MPVINTINVRPDKLGASTAYTVVAAETAEGERIRTITPASGAVVVDFAYFENIAILTGNAVFSFTNVPASGYVGATLLTCIQGNSGGYSATFPAAVEWDGGTEPTLTPTTVNSKAQFVLTTSNGGLNYQGSQRALDYK
jgi:hypothetical protein